MIKFDRDGSIMAVAVLGNLANIVVILMSIDKYCDVIVRGGNLNGEWYYWNVVFATLNSIVWIIFSTVPKASNFWPFILLNGFQAATYFVCSFYHFFWLLPTDRKRILGVFTLLAITILIGGPLIVNTVFEGKNKELIGSFLGGYGIFSATLSQLSPALHLMAIYLRDKENFSFTESYLMLLFTIFYYGWWFTFSIMKSNIFMMVSNLSGAFVGVVQIITKALYERQKKRRTPPVEV